MTEHKTLLKKVIEKLFPEENEREEVAAVLARYGGASWQPEGARVRLAILKLAGGNIEQIRYYTVQACRNYREILASAEYPNQMANPYIMKNDPGRFAELVEQDLKQYRDWYLGILWGKEGKPVPSPDGEKK
jgi:hypothetical protein